MSFLQQFQSLAVNAPLNRRRALLGLSLLTLTACSRPAAVGKAVGNPVSYYTCTMHPFVKSQDPKGKCPVCGMDLVPVTKSAPPPEASTQAAAVTTATALDAQGKVEISPERMQEIGVTTEVVTKRNLTRTLRAPARVELDQSTLRDINVKAGAGYITKLYASYDGFAFRKGQPLMTVLCEGWLQTQIDYIRAYRAWKRTPLLTPNNSIALDNKLELMRAQIRVWDLSGSQIAALEKFAISTNEIDLRTGHGLSGSFDVQAPFDGYVHTKKAMEGMRFEAGQSLLELADHSQVWVVAQFPENQAMFVNVGQKLTVSFPAMPLHKTEGKVTFIDPHVDEQQRRIMARMVISDRENMFHPGIFAEVSGEAVIGERLTISTSAVVPTGTKYIAFVDLGGGKLEPREIEVGQRSGDYYELISGLKEGEKIVSSANFLIDAESRIQGVLKTWGDRP